MRAIRTRCRPCAARTLASIPLTIRTRRTAVGAMERAAHEDDIDSEEEAEAGPVRLEEGSLVQLVGLKAASLNGAVARVSGGLNEAGRVPVRVFHPPAVAEAHTALLALI